MDPASGAQSGVARGVPEMRRVPAVSGREVHLLRAGRQDLLQARLRQVSHAVIFYEVLVESTSHRIASDEFVSRTTFDAIL